MSTLAMAKPLTGKNILLILLSCFGVVFAVNGYFAYIAVSTMPGEQRGATYEAGLRYNNTLADARAQEALHWSHQAEALPGAALSIRVRAQDGMPVEGLAMDGWLERPSSSKADRKLTFKEAAPGHYEAMDGAPEAGSWILSFTAQKPRAGETPAVYRSKQRIWIGAPR